MKSIISREQIAYYLEDFFYFYLTLQKDRGKISFEDAFTKMLQERSECQNAHLSYFRDMMSVASVMLSIRYFSLWFDESKGFLKEPDLEKINIPDSIFVNKEDSKKFLNIHKITLIRNALNHNNNSNHEKWYLKRENGTIYLYIDLLDARTEKEKQDPTSQPKPFKVRLTPDEFYEIFFSNLNVKFSRLSSLMVLSKDDLTYQNANNIINNLSYRRYYRKKKIKDEEWKPFQEKLRAIRDKKTENDESQKELIKELKELCDEYGFTYTDYPLTIPQKEKIRSNLPYWENHHVPFPIALSHEVSNASIFSEFKFHHFAFLLFFIKNTMDNPDKSLDDFMMGCLNYLQRPNTKSEYAILEKLGLEQKELLCYCQDFDSMFYTIFALFEGYMFDTMIEEEKIEVSGKEYETERIRDSFVHSRHFIDQLERANLFDWDNGTSNIMDKTKSSFNLYRIKIFDLMKFSETFLDEKYPRDNIDYSIQPYYTKNGLSQMFYTKGKIQYRLIRENNDFYLIEIDNEGNQKIVDDSEVYKEFLDELEITDFEQTASNLSLIEIIKEKLREKMESLKPITYNREAL